jgi:Mg2+ and Co2+ transporter CorA
MGLWAHFSLNLVAVWLDTGKPLNADQPGPWAKILRTNQSKRQTTFLPWIQEFPNAALRSKELSISSDILEAHSDNEDSEDSKRTEVEQSAALIHLDYGKTLHPKVMSEDPFYAVHEIFHLCAVSESQFLNTLESKVAADVAQELNPEKNVSPANMIYFQGLLDARADRLRRTITAIKAQLEFPWTRSLATEPTLSQLPKNQTAAQTLLADYKDLLNRAEILSNRCKSRLNILMNRAGIVESNKAIQQAKEVTKLTRLAFVFIPLSFTSSFFGMNLGPFTQNAAYGLWLYFAVSAPLVGFLLAIMTSSLSEIFVKIMRLEKKTTIL